ncbi:MAG: YicC/YloC family endoribonuclease [Candidatus Zixiibacteriota bacterium]
MKSMTGFGRAEQKTKYGKFIIEVSSVNSRFLDYYIKLPRQFSAMENKIRELVSDRLHRGKINLNIELEENDTAVGQYNINMKALRAYHKQLRAAQKELKLTGEITVRDLLLLPDVALPETKEFDLDAVWKALQKVIDKALSALVAMRNQEGLALEKEMNKRLNLMVATIKEVESKTVDAVKTYREKLTKRINELLESHDRDSLRLEEEIVLFADRTDIAEELSRLQIHVEQFRKSLKIKEQIGKRLNFILQEMNREANTIGSKSSEFSISSHVINLKEEIEKLREQVQNIE